MSVIYLSYDMTMMNLDWILRALFCALCGVFILDSPFFLAGLAPTTAFTQFTRHGVFNKAIAISAEKHTQHTLIAPIIIAHTPPGKRWAHRAI